MIPIFSCVIVWDSIDADDRNTNSASTNNDSELISQTGGVKGPGLWDTVHLAGQWDVG